MWPIFKGIIVIKFTVEEFLFSIAPVCYSKWLFPAIYKSIWLSTVFFYYIWFLNEALNFISSFISTFAVPFWCLIWCSNGDVHFFNFSISISNGNILIFVPSLSFDFEHSSFYPARTFDQCLFYALQMEWCFFFISWFHKNKLKILNDNIKNISYPWSLGIVRNHIWVVHYIIHIDDLLQVQNMRT